MANKISMDKQYRLKNGEMVRRILCIDGVNSQYPVVAELDSGRIATFTETGIHDRASTRLENWNLVEVSPYEHFKIDDPVMVRNNGSFLWYRRHFAGVDSEGRPLTFFDGMTSWSVVERAGHVKFTIQWDECRKPTAEELTEWQKSKK